MRNMNRRDFIRTTAGTLAVSLAVQPWSLGQEAAPSQGPLTAATVRKLGKTGLECTLLGMGTGVQGYNHTSALTRKGPEITLATLRRAYERGIRYFDLADQYGSHDFMRQAMKDGIPREKVMLLSKTWSREPNEIHADLERFRKELNTDYIDIVLMHCLTDDRDGQNWPEKLKPCMDALAEAKEKGLIKAKGCSCHSLNALRLAAENPWVDVNLARINPFGEKMDGTAAEVAPLLQKAHDAGHGVLGMKIVGEGSLKDRIPESLKYVLGLGCVDAMPVGFLAPEEVDSFVDHVEAAGKALAQGAAQGAAV